MHTKLSNNYSVSIGIPTLNRSEEIKLLLECIINSNVKPDYIICCDQSDDNETKQVFENFKNTHPDINVIYFKLNIRSATRSRNMIMKKCPTDYLILVDDDILFNTTFIRNLVESLDVNIKCININKIESEEYKKIFTVYGDFISNSEMIESFFPRRNLLSRAIDYINKLSFNSYYKANYLGFNRLGRVVGDYRVKKDIIGKVFSGIMVLHRDVFTKYFLEEMLSGYSLLEDIEFSLRVSSEYDIYVFHKLWIYHNKKNIDPSRLDKAKLIALHYKNSNFIFQKHFEMTVVNKILMIYSKLVFSIIQSLKCILTGELFLVEVHLKCFVKLFRIFLDY